MSALRPIALGSLANEAFEKIVQAITAGELKPGERLSEAYLARQLGISRGPLREALGRLEGRLVERTPRIGVSVIELSDDSLVELFTVREALEGMACRLAATNATDAELAELEALLDQHGRNEGVLSEDGYYQRTSDNDFHFQIVRCARNQRLEEMLLEGLYFQLKLYRFRAGAKPGRARAAFGEHRKIVKALQARDPNAAEAAMRQHIRNAVANIVRDSAEAQVAVPPKRQPETPFVATPIRARMSRRAAG
jgi:DNA-binding GntR family transcriptional regulator